MCVRHLCQGWEEAFGVHLGEETETRQSPQQPLRGVSRGGQLFAGTLPGGRGTR